MPPVRFKRRTVRSSSTKSGPSPICDKSPTTQDFLSNGRASWQASWQTVDAGALAISVEIDLYSEGETILFKADPAVTNGRVVGAVSRTDAKLTFVVVPDAGATVVQVAVELSCATKPEVLKLGLDVAKPVAGQTVTISSLE